MKPIADEIHDHIIHQIYFDDMKDTGDIDSVVFNNISTVLEITNIRDCILHHIEDMHETEGTWNETEGTWNETEGTWNETEGSA